MRCRLSQATGSRDGLFLPDRSLGSLGAKLALVRRLGLIAIQPVSAHGPLDPALRDYILLITILVAFLEATAQQLTPIQSPVLMGLSGISRVNGSTPAP